jgi:hypothetical protein
MVSLPGRLLDKMRRTLALSARWGRERRMAHQVALHAVEAKNQPPVIFFNASTRLGELSYNGAYHQLAAWALHLQGIPVIHFVCSSGMSRCVQGTNRDNHLQAPPCRSCLAQSHALYALAGVDWFGYEPDPELSARLEGLALEGLMAFTYQEMPLGALVTPSLRWVLRRYHLADDPPTRFLCRQYILSAWNVARKFSALLDQALPQVVVVFNGAFFPEATAGWVARQRGLRVITHETGFLPFTGFFTDGNATAYPLDPPAGFELTPEQNARLDAHLELRFQGNFSIAGVRFWPEIKKLDEPFLEKMAGFRQVVPVFTNVIFDTSQGHANHIFEDMFAWLDQLQAVINRHPETLFVVRAHPDEGRQGKASRETVADWVHKAALDPPAGAPNVVFINSNDYVSSYELVQRSKFILVYNSSIGLEASILGKPVLCAGKVRYHTDGCQTVFLPESVPAYFQQLETWLAAGQVEAPAMFRQNARRFLYCQVFLASLPFDRYLQAEGSPGFVGLTGFTWEDLLPERSPTMQVLVDGILNGEPFLLPLSPAVPATQRGHGPCKGVREGARGAGL